ncbi:SDR family NAD(P)-dependent oxidoreductase [Spongiibacter sp. KMU-158]|uniref:SDR family NAD(P)-dependent oxidoreductase n=1 Tax=Spongiibacter pelagi TaxID=2760804 RepID=A0A927C210_9GAMM|nr:SDR family NAD(P)-dependent oxidoreductase [Spongiibacter pelagi]MBD2859830.1 SDR family NAD(P)-dependent oxidoreductase [Spongiibacter pelagi]
MNQSSHSDFFDKIAVITGASSGFGRELAKQAAARGMKLVLADVDGPALAETAGMLGGVDSVCLRCDVSNPDDVKELAETAYAEYGAVHLLFNNAGVMATGPVWASTPEDWQWILGVNLMGVVHGIQSFVPRMLEQSEPAHIINTASLAGLTSVNGSGAYCASKHSVVTLSECLHHDLAQQAVKHIGVSVLCPAFVPTGIADAGRNRPDSLASTNPDAAAYEDKVRKAVESGRLSAADIARITFEGIEAGQFYILPHKAARVSVTMRMEDILEGRAPRDPSVIR